MLGLMKNREVPDRRKNKSPAKQTKNQCFSGLRPEKTGKCD